MPQTSLQQILRSLKQHVRRGDDVREVASSTRINAIMDAIWALARGDNLIAGVNLRKKLAEGYFVLSADTGGGRRGGGAGDFPWEISVVNTGTDEAPVWSVKVRPGTINSIVPSNMFTPIDIDTTGTFYVSLDCTTDGTSVTGAVIAVGTDPPDPIDEDVGAAPDFFQLLLGMVVDLTVFQFLDYVFFAFPVRTIYSVTDSPDIGQPYYDLHYTWQISPDPQ